jgi:hypothetical protein
MLYCLLDKQLNSMLLLESLISVIGIFKSELMSFVHCLLDKQLNSMLLLESLISIIGIFKSELMSYVALFTGQTAEQYVITGVTNLKYLYF